MSTVVADHHGDRRHLAGGGTPTAEAINAGRQYFKGNTDGNTHYMLLATDGAAVAATPATTATAAEAAVTAAATAGIKTIVVGIGNDPTGDATLTAMANNGGMPNTASGQKAYYQVNTTTDLVTALNTITGPDRVVQLPAVDGAAEPRLRRDRRQQRHEDPARPDPHERLGFRRRATCRSPSTAPPATTCRRA